MSPVCAARDCLRPRRGLGLFCDAHATALSRKIIDSEAWPWPLLAPTATPKLVVKWDKEKFQYVATRPDTEVTGYSDVSPGGAIRDWQRWWDECPF